MQACLSTITQSIRLQVHAVSDSTGSAFVHVTPAHAWDKLSHWSYVRPLLLWKTFGILKIPKPTIRNVGDVDRNDHSFKFMVRDDFKTLSTIYKHQAELVREEPRESDFSISTLPYEDSLNQTDGTSIFSTAVRLSSDNLWHSVTFGRRS